MDINIKKEYKTLYSKIDLRGVLDSYNISYRECAGKHGTEFVSCCPFPDHDDASPSFSISESTGIYNCFSLCGGGNFFKFIQKMEKLDSIVDAIKFIKIKLNIGDEAIDNFKYVKNSFNNLKTEQKNEEEENIELKEFRLPTSEPAEKYLSIVKKRVSLATIKKFRMRYCVKDDIYH